MFFNIHLGGGAFGCSAFAGGLTFGASGNFGGGDFGGLGFLSLDDAASGFPVLSSFASCFVLLRIPFEFFLTLLGFFLILL